MKIVRSLVTVEGGGVYQCSLSVMITRDYNYVVMRYEMVLSSIG